MKTEDALERYQQYRGSQPAVDRPHYPFTVGEAALVDYHDPDVDDGVRGMAVDAMAEVTQRRGCAILCWSGTLEDT